MRHYLETTVMWLENEISLKISAKHIPHDKYRTFATTSVVQVLKLGCLHKTNKLFLSLHVSLTYKFLMGLFTCTF